MSSEAKKNALGAGNIGGWGMGAGTEETPPSLSCPTPCPSRGGGGGASLGQHKYFCYGSKCCCVGDCVVRHCRLYPLYSRQDILLTFAEMELDSTTIFTM